LTGASAHGGHADRVAGGVVEIAGDPGAFLGSGEQALALGLALGAHGVVVALGDLRAAGAFARRQARRRPRPDRWKNPPPRGHRLVSPS
jgi:hypothetical protein